MKLFDDFEAVMFPEENLIFAGFFGWYPALYPRLQKMPRLLRLPVKLALFNATILAIESLVIYVLAPEAMGSAMAAVLLLLGNVTFLLYDKLIPKFTLLSEKRLKRLF